VAYGNSDIRRGASGCYLWFDDLWDTKHLPLGGQDLYIRMAASELSMFPYFIIFLVFLLLYFLLRNYL
jgi:hypothetical protein